MNEDLETDFNNDLKKFIKVQARALNTGLQAHVSKKESSELSKKIIECMEARKITELKTEDGTYYLVYSVPRLSFNMAQFKEDQPELYSDYLIRKEGKPSLVFAPKEPEDK